jgi:hypothetical protein
MKQSRYQAQADLCALLVSFLGLPTVKGGRSGSEERINRLCQHAFNDFSYIYALANQLIKIERTKASISKGVLESEHGRLFGNQNAIKDDVELFTSDLREVMPNINIKESYRHNPTTIRLDILGQLLIRHSFSSDTKESLSAIKQYSLRYLNEWVVEFSQGLKANTRVVFYEHVANATMLFWETFCLYHSIAFTGFDDLPDLTGSV